jgi:hypothetical protein
LAARTRSSSGPLSALVGALAVLALPAAVVVSRLSERFELLDAAFAIPVAAVLGILAIVLARRGRAQVRSLRRAGGAQVAAGRALGLLGLCLAITAAIAVGFYAFLVAFQ